jgi:PAS domain S-box-containing protein
MATLEPEVIEASLASKRQHLEELLQESEQRFRLIAEATPAMIWMADAQQQLNYVNSLGLEFTECSLEQKLSKSWVQGIHPEDKQQYQNIYSTAFNVRETFQIEYRRQRADGEYRWILETASPRFTPNGSFVGYIGSCIDITDRKNAEEKLRQKTAEQQEILQLFTDLYFRINSEGTIVDYTAKNFSNLYVAPERVLGKAIEEVLPPSVIQPIQKGISEIAQTQAVVSLEYSIPLENREGIVAAKLVPLCDRQIAIIIQEIAPRKSAGSLHDMTARQQAEVALQETEERFRAIFDQAAVGMNLTELNGSWLLVNQKFCDLVGYTQEEMLLRTFQEITYPEDLDADLEYVRQLLAGEIQTYSIEKRYLHKEGSLVWVNVTVSLVRSPEGKPRYMIRIVQDISDRIALEKELALRQARFDAFFSSAPVGMEIIDNELRFAHINETLAEIDGCSVADHLGKTIVEIVPNMASDLEAMYKHILKTGESILHLEEIGETPKQPGVLRYWMSSRFPLLGEDGKPIAVGGVCTEITERKRTEEALKASEARLRLALNAAQMGVWDWNLETNSLTYSEREESIFDFIPGSFDGSYEAYFNKIHPEDRRRVTQANQNTIEHGAEYDIDYRIIGSDNTVRWITEKGAVLQDETGKPVRMIGITMDVTDRKQTEEFLRQSTERYRKLAQQKELLYRISSQIRNSLNLNTILETAVAEIRSLLQIERCLFIWYRVQGESGTLEVLHEAKPCNLPSLLGCYPVETLEPLVQPVLDVEVPSGDALQNLQDAAVRKFFHSLGYSSVLNLPIQTPSGEVGMVVCVNGKSLPPWHEEEVELLACVCDQLAIAINQAELYSQSRAAATVATEKATQLEHALSSLQQTQLQLIQTEKMSSLGQLVAGLAHEINNPVSFIYGNVNYASNYIKDLLNLLSLYRDTYAQPTPDIQVLEEAIDLDFLVEDLPKLLFSMKVGADRIHNLILSLRNFSRLDEAEKKLVDIHEGLNNTLLILKHRLKEKAGYPEIQVIKDYGQLPLVNCYPGQLNQVFMNLLTNAIDAFELCEVYTIENPLIGIRTEVNHLGYVTIRIADNGPGMSEAVLGRLFDPFFTTKPVGKGTGLGLSISYQIVVEKHKGTLECHSELGKGTEFIVTLPNRQSITSAV